MVRTKLLDKPLPVLASYGLGLGIISISLNPTKQSTNNQQASQQCPTMSLPGIGKATMYGRHHAQDRIGECRLTQRIHAHGAHHRFGSMETLCVDFPGACLDL
jgi:hypothetical protein